MVLGKNAQRLIAESELTLAVSKGRKIIEIPWDKAQKEKKLVSKTPLSSYIKDYYLSNSICRASKIMGSLARSRNSTRLKKAS